MWMRFVAFDVKNKNLSNKVKIAILTYICPIKYSLFINIEIYILIVRLFMSFSH